MKSQSYCVECNRDYHRARRRAEMHLDQVGVAVAMQAACVVGFRMGARQQVRRINGLTYAVS